MQFKINKSTIFLKFNYNEFFFYFFHFSFYYNIKKYILILSSVKTTKQQILFLKNERSLPNSIYDPK